MSLTNEDKDWIVSVIRSVVKEENRDLEARIERAETSLLTEFRKSASPPELKLRSHRDAIRALDLQIEAIAGRVAKLEGAQGWQLS